MTGRRSTHPQVLSSHQPSENLADCLGRARTAPSIEEAVACLNQANALAPSDPDVQQATHQIIRALLEQNPHLDYLDETSERYQVRSSERMALIVPKERSIPEPYPAAKPALVRWAQRFLWLALLGLLPAGLGAMLFAPLAAFSALGLNLTPMTRSSRILSLVLILLSSGLWLCGLLLGVILLMHLI
jgi:hypothetical protein